MSLRSLSLDFEYRSDTANIAMDLFVPLLEQSSTYDRAAGYFTSSGMAAVARGLGTFVRNNGTMRLVTSPALKQSDIDAIEDGIEAREDRVQQILIEEIARWTDPKEIDEIAFLSWLISKNRLEIRIAIPTGGSRPGIYHEKLGLFSDGDHEVAVSGSSNETRGGLVDNYESVDVFTSWSEPDRVARKREHFGRLWDNRTNNLDVLAFPEAARRALLEAVPPTRIHNEAEEVGDRPVRPTLREYQAEAIAAWENNDRLGIFEMATGTGKTITTLAAIERLKRDSEGLVVVILAPYIHLVDQWVDELRRQGQHPLVAHGPSQDWLPRAIDAIERVVAGVTTTATLVTTHAAIGLPAFAEIRSRLSLEDTLLVADEVHHLGSRTVLPHLLQARYRLGLSATPRRWNDDAGTERLMDFFGGVVYEFGLNAAIDAGYLTPYRYKPILVSLSEDELEEYRDVVEDLENELEQNHRNPDRSTVRTLMKRRSAVLNHARGKLGALRTELEESRPDRTLIYGASREQLGAIQNLAWDLGVTSQQFTAEEGADERRSILRAFDSGRIPCLAAIRCLDEGVDVPSTREAYLLASSGNPLQFIQRRGRVLRLSPGKEFARIVDFVVLPEPRHPREAEILARELDRVVEFANGALNRAQALEPLTDHIVNRTTYR